MILTGTLRRTATLVLGASLVVLVAAGCAEEDPESTDLDSVTTTESGGDALETPDTTITPDTDSTPTMGTPAAGASPADGSPTTLDDLTLDDLQAFIDERLPVLDVTAITDVELTDGELTIETTWDSANEADATELCEEALGMELTDALSSVVIVGEDGSVLAEC